MAGNHRLKYIVVTPFFPSPERWQGSYVLDQVKAIQRNSDFEVIVFKTNTINFHESDYEIDGVKVHCFNPLLMPSHFLNGLTDRIVKHQFITHVKHLGIDIEEIGYVHCHTLNHGAFGLGLKRLNHKIKVLLQFHDPDPFSIRNGKLADLKFNRRFRANYAVRTMNRVDMLICISENVKNAVTSFPNPRDYESFESALRMMKDVAACKKVTNNNIYILNNGVDTTLFNNIGRQDKAVFRIGCIANFNDWKDQITLVKAFGLLIKKGHRDIRLSLLGTGERRQGVEKYIANNQLGDYVEWPPEVHHDKLPDYYRTLDLFVLPSRFEGFGCVYTEAYACGVPFICCKNQGAYECIAPQERDKWSIPDRDYVQLSRLIEQYYMNPTEQHLCKEIDIDILITNFVKSINIQ